MFARALFAFLALPGIVAFAVPLALWRQEVFDPAGLLPLGIGFAALLWCVRDFYIFGKGTLAPWAPPKNLVVCGLYRYSRNPMYVAVILILAGWAIGFHSRLLLGYMVVVMVAFHCRIVWGEEPWLARSHGEQWEEYRRRVPRWLANL